MQKIKSIGKFFVGLIFIFTTVYETLITSDIIVPNKVTPFTNLTEVINAGYKIAFYGESTNDSKKIEAEIETWFREDYEKHKIFDKLKDTVEYKGTGFPSFYDLNNTRIVMSSVDPKYAFYDRRYLALTPTYTFQHVEIVMKKLKCFRVEENMKSDMRYWFFYNHIRHSFIKSIRKMNEFGFRTFWKRLQDIKDKIELLDLAKRLSHTRDIKDNYKNNMITLANLLSLFALFGCFILLAVLAFAFECRKLNFSIENFLNALYALKEKLNELITTARLKLKHPFNKTVVELLKE